MLTGVLTRAAGIGAIAGAAAGIVATFVAALSTLPHSPGEWVERLGGALAFSMMTMWVGAFAGVVLSLLAGLVLGALAPLLAGRVALTRIAGAVALGGVVAGFGAVLAGLGMSPVWVFILTGPESVVALVAGAWSGPYLVSGRRLARQ